MVFDDDGEEAMYALHDMSRLSVGKYHFISYPILYIN